MVSVIDWILINRIELIAAILGIVGIFLQIKQNHWYWLTSIVMVSMYIFVFYDSGFYADMGFQVYYLVISLYGWYYWITRKASPKEDNVNDIKTTKLNLKQWIICVLTATVFFAFIYLILKKFTNSSVPIGDAFTTALSFVATWLLARRILENWLFWIVVDIVSTGLYIYKGLYPTAILFFVLSVLAFVGYFKWRKALVNE
ncbi:MAG: nicotinamide riboside transporter PnuC [Bacteroidales bacterium]|nr:nicotinamide riboside transporter PnuC [Bacteroidales bacterium]